eukprot:953727_1
MAMPDVFGQRAPFGETSAFGSTENTLRYRGEFDSNRPLQRNFQPGDNNVIYDLTMESDGGNPLEGKGVSKLSKLVIKSEGVITYDASWISQAMNFFVGAARFTIFLGAVTHLFHYIPIGWQTRFCTQDQIMHMGDDGDNLAPCEFQVTFLVRFGTEAIVCLLVIWDCVAHGHMLIGYQDYDSKTGIASLAESIYMHAHAGVFAFRAMLWSILIICDSIIYKYTPYKESEAWMALPVMFGTFMPFLGGGGIILACTALQRCRGEGHPWLDVETESKAPSLKTSKGKKYRFMGRIACALSFGYSLVLLIMLAGSEEFDKNLDEKYSIWIMVVMLVLLMYLNVRLGINIEREYAPHALIHNMWLMIFLEAMCYFMDVVSIAQWITSVVVALICVFWVLTVLNLDAIKSFFSLKHIKKMVTFGYIKESYMNVYYWVEKWFCTALQIMSCVLAPVAFSEIIDGFDTSWFVGMEESVVQTYASYMCAGFAPLMIVVWILIIVFDRKFTISRADYAWLLLQLMVSQLVYTLQLCGLFNALNEKNILAGAGMKNTLYGCWLMSVILGCQAICALRMKSGSNDGMDVIGNRDVEDVTRELSTVQSTESQLRKIDENVAGQIEAKTYHEMPQYFLTYILPMLIAVDAIWEVSNAFYFDGIQISGEPVYQTTLQKVVMMISPIVSILLVIIGSHLSWRFKWFTRSDMILMVVVTGIPSLMLNYTTLILIDQNSDWTYGDGFLARIQANALILVSAAAMAIDLYMPAMLPARGSRAVEMTEGKESEQEIRLDEAGANAELVEIQTEALTK